MFNRKNIDIINRFYQPSVQNIRPVITEELQPQDTTIKRIRMFEDVKPSKDIDKNFNLELGDESTSEEELTLKWIVDNCPPVDVVRKYFKEQLCDIQDNSEFDFLI